MEIIRDREMDLIREMGGQDGSDLFVGDPLSV